MTSEKFKKAVEATSGLTRDELILLNKFICQKFRNISTEESTLKRHEFSVGSQVCFKSNKYGIVEGSITKLNKTTATVNTIFGNYRVQICGLTCNKNLNCNQATIVNISK